MKFSDFKMILLRRSSQVLLSVLCALLVAFVGQTAFAQTFSASITGTVTDSTGAAIPKAQIKLQNMVTHDVREQLSSASGSYNFQNLLPGTYELTASAEGFKNVVQSGLILRANTAATVNTTMQIGSTQQRVVVSANTVLLDTQTPNNSVTLDSVLVEGLPNNTRNPFNFVFDLAGTTEAQGGMTSRSQSFDQNASMFGINGGRSGDADILIDGAPSTAIDWGGLMVSPMQDSVQELQIVQNEYDAQYDRGGEGVVTLVTKGGSDHFHGEFYDYMRNDALDANTWSNDNVPAANLQRKPKFHRNQFGANIGGPIWRSHNLFFFGAYEGLRQPGSLGVNKFTVPTDLERKGDFSQTYLPSGQLDVIYDPYSSHLVTDAAGNTHYTRDPYPGNKIPGGFDPVGQKLLSLYPEPNAPSEGVADLNNYIGTAPNDTTNDKFDWRVDWNQSPIHRIFVRMSDRVRENQQPGCIFCTGADNISGNDDHGMQVAVNDTLTPNANWVIDTYGAFSRWWEGQTAVGYGVADLSKIGLSRSLSQAPLLPLVYQSGNYSQLGSSYSSYQRYIRYLSTGSVNVTREWGQHTLKFGLNYDVNMINIRQDAPINFNFSNDQTGCEPNTDPGGGACVAMTGYATSLSGNSIASTLIGVGAGGGANFNMDPAMSEHSFGMYIQDNWRATSRLTVYAGLRYSNQRPATERHNRVAYFDPKAINSLSQAAGFTVKGAFEYAGVDGRSRSEWEPDNLNFAPRLGLAYRITDKLVGRVGGGIFYEPSSAMLGFDDGGQSPGYTATTPWVATQGQQGYIPQNLVSNPFPNGETQPTGNKRGDQTLMGIGAGQVWVKGPHPTGALYQWSADFQYQVTPRSVAEIGYTGVRGRRLLYGNPNLDLDQLPTADLSMGTALNDLVPNPYYGIITDPNSFLSYPTVARNSLLRPFPAFGYLQMTRSTPGARSQFDALNVKYSYQVANGLNSVTTYQWSKNLDNGSEAGIGWTGVDNWRDATNTKLDYSLSTRDVPQSFAEALVYQLPYGPGQRWGSQAPWLVRQTLGGWTASTAVRLASGLPLPNPVTFYNNPLGNYGFPGSGLPDLVGNPKPAHRSKTEWINPAAFQGIDSVTGNPETCDQSADGGCQPFLFRYGNEPAHMNQLREAANNSTDLGVSKVFGSERIHTEFRGDFLNVFNHPIYGGGGYGYPNIGTCLNCGNVGIVYGTRNDPREIQLSLKVTY